MSSQHCGIKKSFLNSTKPEYTASSNQPFCLFHASNQTFGVRTSPLRLSEETAETVDTVEKVVEEAVEEVVEKSVGAGGKLVAIKEENVEFTAGIIGGIAGFAIGGPVIGAIGAAAANYAAKTDNEVSDIISAVSKSSIEVYNYLVKLDDRYELLTKAKASLESALAKLKSNESVDNETVKKVEAALATTTAKISEINEEYDVVGAGVTAFGVFGDLIEKAVTKAGELNEEYKLTDKALTSLNKASTLAKEKAAEVSK